MTHRIGNGLGGCPYPPGPSTPPHSRPSCPTTRDHYAIACLCELSRWGACHWLYRRYWRLAGVARLGRRIGWTRRRRGRVPFSHSRSQATSSGPWRRPASSARVVLLAFRAGRLAGTDVERWRRTGRAHLPPRGLSSDWRARAWVDSLSKVTYAALEAHVYRKGVVQSCWNRPDVERCATDLRPGAPLASGALDHSYGNERLEPRTVVRDEPTSELGRRCAY